MLKIIIFIIIFIYVILKLLKVKINIKSFFRKGFKKIDNDFGVVCVSAKQGEGKTLNCLHTLYDNKSKKIYSNISLTGLDYTSFTGLQGLLDLYYNEDIHDCVIFYDEIFSALTKSSKITTEVLAFLSQMRKRKILFITTCQEWLELPMTLRRYCRYNIEVHTFNTPFFCICIKSIFDAYSMKWDNLQNEYIAPKIGTEIYKPSKKIANSYDTYEVVKTT